MSIREYFDASEKLRKTFEEDRTQQSLTKAISSYELTCRSIERQALFSSNETVEDVITSEIRFLLADFHLATLLQQRTGDIDARCALLQKSLTYHKMFLERVNSYSIVPQNDAKQVAAYLSNGDSSVLFSSKAQDRRKQKIERFQSDKLLAQRMRQLEKADSLDENLVRQVSIFAIHLAVSKCLQEIETIDLELSVLQSRSLPEVNSRQDPLERPRAAVDDWRLDNHEPYLSSDGKVLAPFIITSKQDRIRSEVFRPGHSLPTMTIDEYLDLERSRGGILNSSNHNEAIPRSTTQSAEEHEEIERRRLIDWDEFTENNAKGAGNTMNRG